jgi:hypothetical protein
MDTSLFVLAGLAHVRASHQARRALGASSPDGEDGEVSHFHASYRRAQSHHLAKHLVADDKFFLTVRRIRTSPGYFRPVGATDAYAYDFDLYFVLGSDRGLGPVHDA